MSVASLRRSRRRPVPGEEELAFDTRCFRTGLHTWTASRSRHRVLRPLGGKENRETQSRFPTLGSRQEGQPQAVVPLAWATESALQAENPPRVLNKLTTNFRDAYPATGMARTASKHAVWFGSYPKVLRNPWQRKGEERPSNPTTRIPRRPHRRWSAHLPQSRARSRRAATTGQATGAARPDAAETGTKSLQPVPVPPKPASTSTQKQGHTSPLATPTTGVPAA
jgi:hypothetical protein